MFYYEGELKKVVIRMLHAHNAEIIQKESERFSEFNIEEPIRMWSEGEEFKRARQEGRKKSQN